MRAAAAVTRLLGKVASRPASSPGARRAVGQHPLLWVGLAVSVAGLLLALWSFTGDRAYDIGFVATAAVGFGLMVAGVLFAAWGRSIGNRRRRAAARRPKGLKDIDVAPLALAKPADRRSMRARLADVVRGLARRPPSAERARLERATLRCPACDAVFEAEGRRPFDATCRACGLVAAIEAGSPLESLTLKCPACASVFDAEGRRPFDAVCPACAHAARVS